MMMMISWQYSVLAHTYNSLKEAVKAYRPFYTVNRKTHQNVF